MSEEGREGEKECFPSLSLLEQSSAANAETVGLMAEDFAKKGWHFAQKQQSQSLGQSPRPASSPSPRHYSALSTTRTTYSPVANRSKTTPTNSYSCGAGDNSLMALMTGDTASFPPRLRELRKSLADFMRERIVPSEREVLDHQLSDDRWIPLPLIEQLKVSCSVCVYTSAFIMHLKEYKIQVKVLLYYLFTFRSNFFTLTLLSSNLKLKVRYNYPYPIVHISEVLN